MANNTVILTDPVTKQTVECKVNTTDRGSIYSFGTTSLEDEANRVGALKCEFVRAKHAFFLIGKNSKGNEESHAYYVGPSLEKFSSPQIMEKADQLKVQLSITDEAVKKAQAEGTSLHWVPCLFLPDGVETFTLPFGNK